MQTKNLRVNFISNNDITGGNSGSPVINAWGELVGTAFDGNWKAMSGDIAFEKEIQRTISVDIRYILFDTKFAGATHLIDEMTIAPRRKKTFTFKEQKASSIKKVNAITQDLKMKEYFGSMLPVYDVPTFLVLLIWPLTSLAHLKNKNFGGKERFILLRKIMVFSTLF